jgi:hypothetical protein
MFETGSAMTTPKETCPKCGESNLSNYESFVYFACDTKVYTDGSVKDGEYCKLRCRITELENKNERLRDVMEKKATDLEIKATFWHPGTRPNLNNPYARQMFDALRNAAAGIRASTLLDKG